MHGFESGLDCRMAESECGKTGLESRDSVMHADEMYTICDDVGSTRSD